jgi:four helix bundle protein
MQPAQNLDELVVWQLASELSDLCDALARAPRAEANRKFCEQLRESSDSVPANVAEGFGRYLPKENAHFVRIAKGSLLEARSWLLKGKRRGYWPESEYEQAWRLSCRTLKALLRYLQYLDSCDGQLPESIAGPRPAKETRRSQTKEPRTAEPRTAAPRTAEPRTPGT